MAAGDGWVRTGVTIEAPVGPRRQLWYRVHLPDGWRLGDSSDPFVLVPLYAAMRTRLPLHVEGDVSPSLLANLEEFQRFWSRWYRGRFTPVEIVAEREREQPPGEPGAVTAFSGGVDSSFTAYRHATGRAGRQTQTVRAGVMAHGFDIPLEQPEQFRSAADKAESMLATLGLPLVRMATNIRHVEHAWEDVMGAAIASCFLLLRPNARAGLIPSTFPYHLMARWGSHPIGDRLLSSESFRIVHDGAGFSRPAKIELIAMWPAALENLRVCWRGRERDRNCGRCGKCVRTILAFRAVGLPLPPCFDRDATNVQIRRMGRLELDERLTLRMALDAAEERGVSASWVRAARAAYYRSRSRDLLDLATGHVRRRVGLTR